MCMYPYSFYYRFLRFIIILPKNASSSYEIPQLFIQTVHRPSSVRLKFF